MKKLLLPLLLIISGFIFGQGSPCPNYQQFGNTVTRTAFLGIAQGQKGVTIGRYTDTTTANSSGCADYYPGTFIVTDNPRDVLWQRNYNATAWISRAGAGSITNLTFLTDSSIVICFSDGSCDTIPITNNIFVTNNDNTITVFNDSTLIVCSTPAGGPPVCDTIIFNLDSINNFYFLNDSTIVACDTPQVICVGVNCTTQQVCDTITVPARTSLILQNGLQFIAPGVGVFGHPAEGSNPSDLQYDTYLHTNYYQLSVEGKPVLRPPLNVKQIQWNTISGSVASFHHLGPNIFQYPTAIDVENPIKLYIGYTNKLWADTIGFMDDRIGYLMGTNINGNFYSFSLDKTIGKQSGLMYHTLDTAYKDAVTIWGNQSPLRYNFGNTPFPTTTLLDSRIAIFKTDKEVQIPGYPSTRDDGGTSKALYTDAVGNIRLGPVNTGDIITIINDTTINICSFGTNLCDTIIINNIGVIQTVTILNDSTLIVCDSVGVCDTLIITPTVLSNPVTANNGLIMSTPTNVQLGSPTQPGAPLLHQTYIDAGALYSLNINGSVGGTFWVFSATNTGTGSGIVGNAISGNGVAGIATTGTGGSFRADAGQGITATSNSSFAGIFTINPTTTNTVADAISIQRQVNGTAGDGVGQSVNFVSETSDGILWTSNRLISKWTTANTPTRVSQFIITGVNNAITADLFTLSGSGSTRLNKYGVNTFAGTPTFAAGWDANGNFVEFAVPSGISSITADNGLTTNTPTNVRLFGTIGTPATLLDDRYLDQGIFSLNTTGTNTTAVFVVNNTSGVSGDAINGTSLQGFGVRGNSTDNNGVEGHSINNIGVYGIGAFSGVQGETVTASTYGVYGKSTNGASVGVGGRFDANDNTTNNIAPIVQLRRTIDGTAAAAGIGGSAVFYTETTTGASEISNTLASKWVTATHASRTSQLDVIGINSTALNTIMSAYGTGVVGIGISSSYTATRLEVVDNSVGTASIMKLTSTSVGNSYKGIEIDISGAHTNSNQTVFGIDVNVSNTGGASTNVGVRGEATGGALANYGVYGWTDASGGVAAGVYGVASNSAVGGWFSSGTGNAGRFESTSAAAVLAIATTGIGVQSTSNSNSGVQATSGSGTALVGIIDNGTAGSVGNGLGLGRSVTGTGGGANGVGVSITFSIDTDNTDFVSAGSIINEWTNATHASRTNKITINGVMGGSAVDLLTLAGDGSVKLRPITATAASAITPAEGMLVFVSNTDATFVSIGIWCYQNGAWKAL